MILTLKELAEYLRVNERTITRMQEQGKISGVKIGGQWRFNGSEVDKLFFPGKGEEITKEMEQSEPQSALSRPLVGIPLSRVMHENRILLNLNATDRDSLIAEMTSARMMYGVVLDAADIRRKCLDRESVLSTAIGEGIAIPHPRDPIPTLRGSAAVVYGYSAEGIEYNAPDGKPVHHFFLVCSQTIELHLHLMGCMARLLKDQEFVEALPKCTQNADVIRLVMKHERAELAPAGSNH